LQNTAKRYIFALAKQMVIVAQLVRASDCGSEGRGFETHHSPLEMPKPARISEQAFFFGTTFFSTQFRTGQYGNNFWLPLGISQSYSRINSQILDTKTSLMIFEFCH
jgi:hypothetical protein